MVGLALFAKIPRLLIYFRLYERCQPSWRDLDYTRDLMEIVHINALKVTLDLRGVFWGKQYSALCINEKYINLYIIG